MTAKKASGGRVAAPAHGPGFSRPRRVDGGTAPEAVATVLDSLLGNTLAHAGPGSAVSIRIGREAGWAVILVADDGPGLSAANAARAFDPFFTTARERGGTGLGLTLPGHCCR